MGRLLAPHGVKGWIKVQPYTASPATLLEYDRWWLAPREDPDAWKAFETFNSIYAYENPVAGRGQADIAICGVFAPTDHLFFQAGSRTYKAVFDDNRTAGGAAAVAWSVAGSPAAGSPSAGRR